jgi:hypothetical protein
MVFLLLLEFGPILGCLDLVWSELLGTSRTYFSGVSGVYLLRNSEKMATSAMLTGVEQSLELISQIYQPFGSIFLS